MALTRGPRATPSGSRAAVRFYDVQAHDGTLLRAWTNDADGPTVLLCNGLGTNPYAWPALLDPSCGVRVVSWNHRGTGGSQRPADPDAVTIEDFTDDAVAVLDDDGTEAAPVLGWSMGVNTAFQLAVSHPERVSGLMAVGGVPGDTFSSFGAPLFIPRPLRRPLGVGVARTMRRAGVALTPVARRIPVNDAFGTALRYSGFMLPSAATDVVRAAVAEFLTTPVEWYMHLALASSRHRPLAVGSVEVPVALVAGRYDVLASHEDMKKVARRLPDATFHLLPGSHFMQMEHPALVHDVLLDLLERVAATTVTSATTRGDAPRRRVPETSSELPPAPA